MESAYDVARRVVESGVGTVVAAGSAIRRGGGWARASGWAGRPGGSAPVFDLASVTKPMTAVAFARSSADRTVLLEEMVPESRGTPSAPLPLELFFAHRAGLEAHLPLFAPLTLGEAVDAAGALVLCARARRADAVAAPPFAPVYSDLGYILAGAALARHSAERDAGAAIHRFVVRPLGLEGSLGTARDLLAHGVDLGERAAPTEDVGWRGGVVKGKVHDENAWALTGEGGSGHAGMFGTVDAVLSFGSAVLDALDGRGGPLSGHDLAWLVRERDGGTLRAGFDGKSLEGSSAGVRMGHRAFGHLGFTGTSLWIDPDAKVVVSLLTNRVHPTRENAAIRAARPSAHDALYEMALRL